MTIITIPVLDKTSARQKIEVSDFLQVTDEAKPKKDHGMIRIMDPEKGDERITWSKKSLKQILEARNLFIELIKKGFKPFKVGPGGQPSVEVMQEFDSSAEEIIFKPPKVAVGG